MANNHEQPVGLLEEPGPSLAGKLTAWGILNVSAALGAGDAFGGWEELPASLPTGSQRCN